MGRAVDREFGAWAWGAVAAAAWVGVAFGGAAVAQVASEPVAGAQPARLSPATWRPVDATVSDVDPLAASQRLMHPGIGQFTPAVRMYGRSDLDPTNPLVDPAAATDPATGLLLPQLYRYETPGLRARMQRPSYLVLADPSRADFLLPGDGSVERPFLATNRQPWFEPAFVELIPANTVFELTGDAPLPPAAPPRGWVDQRLGGPISGRVELELPGVVADDEGELPHATHEVIQREPIPLLEGVVAEPSAGR
ncbi:MAG: hypothetical protein AAF823_15505 [Planctomycetota bacterium]